MIPSPLHDALSRKVYCLLGLPIDAITLGGVLDAFRLAAARRSPLLLSTPNLNFLVNSRRDRAFHDSLLSSDLCVIDGMIILWMARLLGIPVQERVAGSDLFDALKSTPVGPEPLKVFLFGGDEGIADVAAVKLNGEGGHLVCVGALSPGFGSVAELSAAPLIAAVNGSGADFLLVALGAAKGQAWLMHNHAALSVPIRAHLGATINFQAGTVARAPNWARRTGVEWLWRIKEEPKLWRRYWNDGWLFLSLLVTHVAPLAMRERGRRLLARWLRVPFGARGAQPGTLLLSGDATEPNVDAAVAALESALPAPANLILDLAGVRTMDARFIGLLLTLRKYLKDHGFSLQLRAVPAGVARLLLAYEAGVLLTGSAAATGDA